MILIHRLQSFYMTQLIYLRYKVSGPKMDTISPAPTYLGYETRN